MALQTNGPNDSNYHHGQGAAPVNHDDMGPPDMQSQWLIAMAGGSVQRLTSVKKPLGKQKGMWLVPASLRRPGM